MTSVKLCPNCKKGDVELFIGGQTGSYKCNRCGYVGPVILEIEKVKRKKEKSKKRSRKAKKKS